MCICLCLGLKTLLNTFIRGMSYSSNEIWSSVWYFLLWRDVSVHEHCYRILSFIFNYANYNDSSDRFRIIYTVVQ